MSASYSYNSMFDNFRFQIEGGDDKFERLSLKVDPSLDTSGTLEALDTLDAHDRLQTDDSMETGHTVSIGTRSADPQGKNIR